MGLDSELVVSMNLSLDCFDLRLDSEFASLDSGLESRCDSGLESGLARLEIRLDFLDFLDLGLESGLACLYSVRDLVLVCLELGLDLKLACLDLGLESRLDLGLCSGVASLDSGHDSGLDSLDSGLECRDLRGEENLISKMLLPTIIFISGHSHPTPTVMLSRSLSGL